MLVGKAYVYSALSEFDKGLKIIEKALALKNDLSSAWCAKGDLLSKLDRDEEALECYKKAEGLDDKNASVFNGRGHIFLKQANTIIDDDIDETEKQEASAKIITADKEFDKSLSLKPKYAESLCGKGACLALTMQLDPNKANELESQAQ